MMLLPLWILMTTSSHRFAHQLLASFLMGFF